MCTIIIVFSNIECTKCKVELKINSKYQEVGMLYTL